MSNLISVPRDLAVDLLDGLRITQERARKELRALLAKPAEQTNANFWQWLDSAYRDGSKGEEPRFTKYNMEVAYAAGACAAQPQGEPARWMFIGDDRREHLSFSKQTPDSVPLYTRPAEQPAQKYDDTLLPFMELMRRELHANSHKGDRPEWLKMTASTALEEIAHHFNKLDEAVGARDNPQIREYAADIANICMMLLDICGELAFVRQPEPVSSTSDKYKAELYDEVWQLARDMGFGNVTDALMKLKKQTAPVAVVLPERNKASQNLDLEQCGYVDGWNACLDEVARLNPPQQ